VEGECSKETSVDSGVPVPDGSSIFHDWSY
jgi:hypothetical protein